MYQYVTTMVCVKVKAEGTITDVTEQREDFTLL